MKTLVNCIIFVPKFSFVNDIDNCFLLSKFCSFTSEDNAAVLVKLDHLTTLFLMSNIFLIVIFIVNGSTT